MAVVDDGETIQLFARAKGPVVDTRKAAAPNRGRVVDESDGDDEIDRRARDMAVDPSVIKSQAPMLQVKLQALQREQLKASTKDKAGTTKSVPKQPVHNHKAKGPDVQTKKIETKVSDGPTKKRKLGKKEREKKARAEAAEAAAAAAKASAE